MVVPHSALKVFEPIGAFPEGERSYWRTYAASGQAPPPTSSVMLSRDSGLVGTIATLTAEREHADVLALGDEIFVCPHRTRLRLLASVLAFRRSIPAEVAPAFMPDGEAERAVEELERMRAEHPAWRNHILLSTWEVPLRWFVLFADEERQAAGSIRYQTRMDQARMRTRRALKVLRAALPDPGVVGLVADLDRWLGDFNSGSVLILDYGGVGALFGQQALSEDHSAADIWGAIQALEQGEPEHSAAFYGRASERWSAVRARESSN